MKNFNPGGMSATDAVSVAVTSAAIAAISNLGPGLLSSIGLPAEWSQTVIDFLNAHTTLIPSLFTAGPLASAAPWALAAIGTLLSATGSALPIPGLQLLGKLGQMAGKTGAAATGAMPWAGTFSTQAVLALLSMMFHIDRSAAFVALAAAGWTGAIARLFMAFLPSSLAGVMALGPSLAASFIATAAMLIVSTAYPGSGIPGSKPGARIHGLDAHTLLHAGSVAVAATIAKSLTGAGTGFGGAIGPAAAYAASKLFTAATT